RKLLCFMNPWLAGAAVLLAILSSFQLLNPYVLLFCVFLIGIGFAFHAPAWSAIVPDLVTNEDLPSAATLGGLQLNISGIIGPALGGVLLYFLGANWVFAVNALCFIVVILALLQWKGPEAESGFPVENFLESFSAAVRYVRYSPAIQVVLAWNVVFAFFYLCYTGGDTRHRAEGTSPSTLQPRSVVHFHGGRFGFQRIFSATPSPG